MDEKVPLSTQLQHNVNGGVVLIITYTVNPEDEDKFIKTWTSAAEITKKTSAIISSQLHKGTAGSRVLVSYHVFDSTEAASQTFGVSS